MTAKQEILIGSEPWQRAASLYVRMAVFVLERGLDRTVEFDQNDGHGVTYATIWLDGQPVATGRFLREDETTGRLTRIATLAPFRGQGFGTQIVMALERYAQNQRIRHLQIHAEVTAVPFYTRLGYQTASPTYLEDGVPCRKMVREL